MTARQVLGREDFHRALHVGLAPMIHAIGASIGPDRRGTLFQAGVGATQALSGVEIARRCCSEGGAIGAGHVLLRETLMQADRDLGDGTARLAVMVAAALAAGQKALAAEMDPGMLAACIGAMKPEIDAAFASATIKDVGPAALLTATDMPDDLRAVLIEAVAKADEPDNIDLRAGPPGETAPHSVVAQGGFVWDAEVIGQTALDALNDVSVIVADDIISDFQTLASVIEGFAQKRKALVIAARGLEGNALALIERNRAAGILTVATLKPYDAGPRAATILEDLAVATGAQLVGERAGTSLANLKPAMLGHAAEFRKIGTRVVMSGAAGDPAAVKMRLREIEGDIADNRYLSLDLEHARRRHARLNGTWVEVTLNARHTTKSIMDEARRTLASLGHAARSGVILGGGKGLTQIADMILKGASADLADRASREMLAAALRAPECHIMRNAGHEPGARPVNGVACGVYDPASLSRHLLDQAMSLATCLLSIDRAVLPVGDS